MMINKCEKYDVFNHRWSEIPDLNYERANPGTFITNDKRYLYVF